jgi:formyl-CoA transferase
LRSEGVPCTAPAPFSAEEIVSEPTMRARGVIVTEEHFSAGEVSEIGHTVRFSRSNAWNLRPAPVTGQHSVAILRELERDEATIAQLIADKVVNAPPETVAATSGRIETSRIDQQANRSA